MGKEPSITIPGKVFLMEFADFYCSHCHMFETLVLAPLKEDFGDDLQIHMLGYPIIPGKLATAFEMYQQARFMGKGPEMRTALFHTIHKKKIHDFDQVIRKALIQEVGLDVETFEEGLQSGHPYKALLQDIAWGNRIKVASTPTIVINGNLRIDDPSYENLKTIIQSLLNQDS